RKPGDVESGLPEHIGNYVKVVVVPLHTGFVRSVRAEEAQPGALDRAVIGANGTAPRKARQRLDVWVLFQVMHVAVAQINLVLLTNVVIEAARRLVWAQIEGEQPAVLFELVDQKRASRSQLAQTRIRSDGQSVPQRSGASRRGLRRGHARLSRDRGAQARHGRVAWEGRQRVQKRHLRRGRPKDARIGQQRNRI